MKRSLSALTLLVSISLFFSQIPSEAATKVGGTCLKEGSKSNSSREALVCAKSGKKLVWAKATNSGNSNSKQEKKKDSFVAWATTFDSSALVKQALASTDSYFGKVTPNNSYELNIDPAFTQLDKAWILRSLDYSHGSFSKLITERIKVFLGTTHEWGRDNLRNQNLWVGDPLSPFPCSDGSRDVGCAEKNIILIAYSDVYSRGSAYSWDMGRRSVPAHEMFHAIQYFLCPESIVDLYREKKLIPLWLMEGSANFYGFYVNEKLQFGTYLSGRQDQIENYQEYKKVVPLESYSNFSDLNPYGIGQAATEYLIASIGFENFLNIFRFTNSENSFTAGFKKATGIGLDEFYSKFELARPSLKIGR